MRTRQCVGSNPTDTPVVTLQAEAAAAVNTYAILSVTAVRTSLDTL